MTNPASPGKRDNPAARKQRRINRRSTLITLFAAVLFGGVTIFLLQHTILPFSDYQSEQPVQPRPLMLELLAYKQVGVGTLRKLEVGELKDGDQVVFNLNTTQPVFVAVLASLQNQPPFSLFEGARIPPGANRQLEKGGERFVYEYRQSDTPVKLCVLHAVDAEHLLEKLRHVEREWAGIPASACWEP